jgi:hypothetical protein
LVQGGDIPSHCHGYGDDGLLSDATALIQTLLPAKLDEAGFFGTVMAWAMK